MAIFSVTPLWAGTALLSWDPNTENNLAGYKIYHGTSSGNYTLISDVGSITEFTVNNLADGQTYYFVVTAYDTSGNESSFSSEVSQLIGTVSGSGSGGGSSSSGLGGGGCGRIKDVSGESGPNAGQAVLNLMLLALPIILVKMKYMLKFSKLSMQFR